MRHPLLLVLMLPALSVFSSACRQGDVGIVTSGGDKSSDTGPAAEEEVVEVDDDDDGFSTDDCDDANPDIYPGAPEVADDGIDQDCDGVDSKTLYGHRDDEGETTLVGGYLIGNRITLDAPLQITHLGYTGRAEVAAEVKLAVYSHDGGRPADLVAQTAPTAYAFGVSEVPLLAPVALDAGEWWVQVISSDEVPIASGADELIAYRDQPFDADLPDPYGIATEYDGPRISLFVMGSLP